MEQLTIGEKLTLSRKEAALKRDLKAGLILERPHCLQCGWIGDKPCVYGAGCPQCGARITDDAAKKGKKKAAPQDDDA